MLGLRLLLGAAAISAATFSFAQPAPGTLGSPIVGGVGAPAGVANPTPASPFGSTPIPQTGTSSGFGMPSGSTLPGSGAPLTGSGSASTGSSAGVAPGSTVFGSTTFGTVNRNGVLGPAPTSPGVVTGNSPFPCVIGSATNPC